MRRLWAAGPLLQGCVQVTIMVPLEDCNELSRFFAYSLCASFCLFLVNPRIGPLFPFLREKFSLGF